MSLDRQDNSFNPLADEAVMSKAISGTIEALASAELQQLMAEKDISEENVAAMEFLYAAAEQGKLEKYFPTRQLAGRRIGDVLRLDGGK